MAGKNKGKVVPVL